MDTDASVGMGRYLKKRGETIYVMCLEAPIYQKVIMHHKLKFYPPLETTDKLSTWKNKLTPSDVKLFCSYLTLSHFS